jgi:hypothetical protein
MQDPDTSHSVGYGAPFCAGLARPPKLSLGREDPVATPEPTILAEIDRINKEAASMVQAAIERTVALRERLVGKVTNPDPAHTLSEGLRWPPEGQLGMAYHDAWHMRQFLARLHHELTQLENI